MHAVCIGIKFLSVKRFGFYDVKRADDRVHLTRRSFNLSRRGLQYSPVYGSSADEPGQSGSCQRMPGLQR